MEICEVMRMWWRKLQFTKIKELVIKRDENGNPVEILVDDGFTRMLYQIEYDQNGNIIRIWTKREV